ncbi:MAG TPA: phosphoribosylanthranilate isomerase [Dehalococcoidia bacterium]|nr:phosphoribosylanthranilate isomerase [Dehalococcoidia bacterium]
MTLVKICGLREPDHARIAIEGGAAFLGVIFAESKRQVGVDEARAIREVAGQRSEVLDSTVEAVREALTAHRPLLVGVFAKQAPDEINRIAAAVDLDLIQLSGGEHPSLVQRLHRPVIRAVHVGPDSTLEAVRVEIARSNAIPLLDTKSDLGGGSGQFFDWSIVAAIGHDTTSEASFMLAGGLDPENVATAVQQVYPWAVDVSSGVETDGVKDPVKIRAFLEAVRSAQKATSA